MNSRLFVSLFAFALLNNSCNHLNELTTNISEANSSQSHNSGQNCVNCHKKGGDGDGWFTISGTAYAQNNVTASNVVVNLYTQPNGKGELRKTINGDLLGNFYTTDIQAFGGGLYPAISYNGQTSYMSSSILQGACNSCHGISTDRISVQ
ncbi:MAG: hypothetical protein WED33_03740 [Bacteroidia bacterium]